MAMWSISDERKMLESQNARNQMLADARSQAHQRFINGRADFMESNPGAVSPQEYAATLGRRNQLQDRNALWKQEMDMLREKNAGALAVEAKKAEGMIGQGSAAAQANAAAKMYESDNAVETAMREWENKNAISAREDATKRYDIDARTDTEAYKADAAADAAIQAEQEKGRGAVDVQVAKNKGLSEQRAMDRDDREFERAHEKEIAEIRAQGGRIGKEEYRLIRDLQEKDKSLSVMDALRIIRGESI